MLDRLDSGITLARRRSTRLALLFLDLDNFKDINDSRGHAVGDSVLRDTAACLSKAVRTSDTVSRQGGDEFLLLLVEIAAAADAAQVAAKILAGLNDRAGLGDAADRVTASVGIALYPDDATDAMSLIAMADGAMYRAKQAGGHRFAFHAEPVPSQ